MFSRIRFVMLGGFLGAGKTTAIAQLGRKFQQAGKRVVIVTNDQAENLVDTELLRSQGFDVGEVAGSCFCCNFDGLMSVMDNLSADQRPDVILAEPVGSCTDLIATIAEPMMQMLGEKFDISPYAVLLKPSHGLKILSNEPTRGFSPKAEYIFRKQLEEADLICINRIDELSDDKIALLEKLISEQYPDRPVIKLSAKTGENINDLVDDLENEAPRHTSMMEVDYDIYAEGEAELGWLNATAQVDSDQPFSLDELLVGIIEKLKHQFAQVNAETAHLKAIGQTDSDTAVANLVSSDSPTTLSMASECNTTSARVVVNARVAISPEVLSELTETALTQMSEKLDARLKLESSNSFRPGRPVPTHRVTTANES